MPDTEYLLNKLVVVTISIVIILFLLHRPQFSQLFHRQTSQQRHCVGLDAPEHREKWEYGSTLK